MKRIIFDAHQDLAQYPLFSGSRAGMRETTLNDLLKKNFRLVTASIYPLTKSPNVNAFILSQLTNFFSIIFEDLSVRVVHDLAEMQLCLSNNYLGFLLHLEGLDFLEKPDQIRRWYDIGFRSAGLVWKAQNLFATPCNIDDTTGLTPDGKALIKLLEEKRIIVDLAHLNRQGFDDAVEVAEKPLIFSHGNCRALSDQPRNLTDSQMAELKLNGGIFCLSFYPPFVKNTKKVRLADLVEHFERAIKIMGEDQVGLGSDFGGMLCKKRIAGMRGVYEIDHLFLVLKKHGFSESLIQKIAWENLYNFYQKVL